MRKRISCSTKGKIFGASLTALLMTSGCCFANGDITVLPINNAKFVAGQRFDFMVESDKASGDAITVTIDGKNADEFFGKKPVYNDVEGKGTYRIDGVSISKPGKNTIVVKDGKGERTVTYNTVADSSEKKAKNVILYVGDGLSLPVREMARILSKGITEGKFNGLLTMEQMPFMSLVTTSGYDSLVTDSANSASAYATGHKSVVNAMGVYEDSSKDPNDDPKVENISELVKRTRKMSVGIVSTANITDATPAAMVSHTRRRSQQNYIAEKMLDDSHMPDVILGGGSRHFLPKATPGSKRTDELDLIKKFEEKGFAFSGTRKELNESLKKSDKLLGLFQLNNMDVYIDREMIKDPKVLKDFNDQPNLIEMTDAAIQKLSRNENGFFLMVEGACIDKQLHTLDWQRATYDTIEFDKAVKVGVDFAKKNNDTLIIVVADHSHGASITGTYSEKDGVKGREAVRTYAAAKWPTFKDNDGDGFPEDPNPDVTLAVQFANHPDHYRDYGFKKVPTSPTVMDGKKAIANPDTKDSGEFFGGNIPANESQEVHSADDVVLNAMGPGADYFHGVMDNTEVFFGMIRAMGLDCTKDAQ